MTPLTARTLASFATFLAVVWLAFGFTAQWSRLDVAGDQSLSDGVAEGAADDEMHLEHGLG